MTQRKPYPSDVSREQFEVIRPQLEGFRRDTRPRTYDLYDIFCGILYVKNTGCQWSALPHDYPPYHTVYTSFREWGAKPFSDQPSLWESLLQQLVESERESDGRKKKRPWLL